MNWKVEVRLHWGAVNSCGGNGEEVRVSALMKLGWEGKDSKDATKWREFEGLLSFLGERHEWKKRSGIGSERIGEGEGIVEGESCLPSERDGIRAPGQEVRLERRWLLGEWGWGVKGELNLETCTGYKG